MELIKDSWVVIGNPTNDKYGQVAQIESISDPHIVYGEKVTLRFSKNHSIVWFAKYLDLRPATESEIPAPSRRAKKRSFEELTPEEQEADKAPFRLYDEDIDHIYVRVHEESGDWLCNEYYRITGETLNPKPGNTSVGRHHCLLREARHGHGSTIEITLRSGEVKSSIAYGLVLFEKGYRVIQDAEEA